MYYEGIKVYMVLKPSK